MITNQLPVGLQKKINDREKSNAVRVLSEQYEDGIDFYSNDYLGFARNKQIAKRTQEILAQNNFVLGSTGSRLISGTHRLHLEAENLIANHHNSPSALLYNSGYDANLGLFSSILQKRDVILYDELIHASVRDGIRLGLAKSYRFKHNNLEDLEQRICYFKEGCDELYIAIESVYSMDGDLAPIASIVELCEKHQVKLIVDEAHSTGVYGDKGEGLVCDLGLENRVFARLCTFGKAMGCHGAVVLGSYCLKKYLINFSRSFIYTTALGLHAVANIIAAYEVLGLGVYQEALFSNIAYFKSKIEQSVLKGNFLVSDSAVQCCVISGNQNVKSLAKKIQDKNILIKPILHPTVSKGKERLRFCLHSFNHKKQIDLVFSVLEMHFKVKFLH